MRAAKLLVLAVARFFGGFWLARRLTRRGVRILCYHGIWLGQDGFPGDAMFMSADTFRRRLAAIRRSGQPVITLSTAVEGLRGDRPLPPAPVVITIDDGWFSTVAEMVPALRAAGMPATLYCDTAHLLSGMPVPHVMARYFHRIAGRPALPGPVAADLALATDLAVEPAARLAAAIRLGEAVGLDPDHYRTRRVFEYLTPTELADAARHGLDIQLHTHRHTLHTHSPDDIRREIEDNTRVLSDLLGVPASRFQHFCYPSGEWSSTAVATLAELGLASATTTDPSLAYPGANPYLLPRILDGENLSPLEFESELSGFGDFLRAVTAPLRRRRTEQPLRPPPYDGV